MSQPESRPQPTQVVASHLEAAFEACADLGVPLQVLIGMTTTFVARLTKLSIELEDEIFQKATANEKFS